ncbi:MAG: porin family protein, partial [Candidatus Saccharicenans sp.]|nr:porin family protein [Candidatus Saccharicenans sp.]
MKRRMKGTLGFLVALLMLGLVTMPARAGIHFGLKGGLSLANIKSDPPTFEGFEWKTKQGIAGGASLEIGLIKGFSLQPEILYVQKGAKITANIEGMDITLNANIDYIEIPLLLKYNLISGGPTVPSVYVGPYIGFNTKAEFVISITGYPEEREDIKDDIKNTEYGLTFGVGLTQKLGLFR